MGEGTAFEFETNVTIARNLSTPAIVVVSGENKTTAQIINSVLTVLRNFETREVQVLAIVANKVKTGQAADVRHLLAAQVTHGPILAVIPENKNLESPTMKEIQEQLGGKIVFGEQQLSNQVDNFITGAMQVPHF